MEDSQYNDAATQFLKATGAKCAMLIIVDGDEGSGGIFVGDRLLRRAVADAMLQILHQMPASEVAANNDERKKLLADLTDKLGTATDKDGTYLPLPMEHLLKSAELVLNTALESTNTLDEALHSLMFAVSGQIAHRKAELTDEKPSYAMERAQVVFQDVLDKAKVVLVKGSRPTELH